MSSSASPQGAQRPVAARQRGRNQQLSPVDADGARGSLASSSAQTQAASTTRQRASPPGVDGGDAPPARGVACAQEDPIYESDTFRIQCFKILPCGKRYAHDWMRCPFRHPGEKAARRPLTEGSWYSATMCPDLDGMTCPRGDACGFSHNVFEHWLHPDRYRTQLCRDGSACHRRVCFFAHSIQELRTPSGRVIPAAENAEAAVAAMAAADWTLAGSTAGLSVPPQNCFPLSPAEGECGVSRPLLNEIPFIPMLRTDSTLAGLPYTAAAAAPVLGASGSLNGDMDGSPPPAAGSVSLSSAELSGLLQKAAGLMGHTAANAAALPLPPGHDALATAPCAGASAGLAAPGVSNVFQALMQDAADKRSEAAAAVEAAARAQAAADEAAALISHLVFVGPQPSISSDGGAANAAVGVYNVRPSLLPTALAGPEALLQIAQLRERRTVSASGMALVGGADLPQVGATYSACSRGTVLASAGGPSSFSGPLPRLISGGDLQQLSSSSNPSLNASATATLLAAAPPLLDTAAKMVQLPGGLVATLAPSAQHLVLQTDPAEHASVVWYASS